MAIEITSVAEALFEKIRSRFEDVSVGDEKAKATQDPKNARFFNFDYIDAHKNDFGNVTVSIIDAARLKIYFGKNITSEMDTDQKEEWYDFLRDIRMFAKRNMMSFDAKDITRSNLNIKDIKQLSTSNAPDNVGDTSVTESRLFGTTKTSYDKIAPGTRLIIRHSDSINDDIHGSRSRKIKSVYVEDADGQRFKCPFNHLGGCRALGRHVANEGQINDKFGKHIVDLVQEMGKIKGFIQGSRNKVYEDDEANKMVQAAKGRYKNIHHILQKLSKARGYKFYRQDWKPAVSLQDDIDLEALRNKFVTKDFDGRLDPALAHVYAAYHSMKEEPEMEMTPAFQPQVEEFSDKMDQIEEGTWAVPEDDLAIKHLQELMSDVLVAGVDGMDATNALYELIGDDELFDKIYDAADGSPEMDVRPIVFDWLKSHLPSVFKQVKASMEAGDAPEEPEQPAPEEPQPEEQPAPEQQKAPPSLESKYYSVESDSTPYYLHAGKILENAQKIMQKALKQGKKGVVIYEISVKRGKKFKSILESSYATPKPVNSEEIFDIKRLAGLK